MHEWEGDGEGAALVGTALKAYRAAVTPHNLVGHGQTQAGSAPPAIACLAYPMEGLEDTCLRLLRNPDPGIRDRDHRAELFWAHPYGHLTAGAVVPDSVLDHIADGTAQKLLIAANRYIPDQILAEKYLTRQGQRLQVGDDALDQMLQGNRGGVDRSFAATQS